MIWGRKHIISNIHGAHSSTWFSLLDWNVSQSRSLMMNPTQEPWQLFGAGLSRWAGLLCVHTHHRQPTHLLHPVCVFCQWGRVDRTLLHHSAFSKPLGTCLSLSLSLSLHLSFRLNKYTLKVNLRGSNLPQLQEGWGELVSDKTAGVGVAVLPASR